MVASVIVAPLLAAPATCCPPPPPPSAATTLACCCCFEEEEDGSFTALPALAAPGIFDKSRIEHAHQPASSSADHTRLSNRGLPPLPPPLPLLPPPGVGWPVGVPEPGWLLDVNLGDDGAWSAVIDHVATQLCALDEAASAEPS